MMCQLNAPGFIPALCAHEAAHLIYYEMMGPIRYEPLPPRLEYDAKKGDYVGHLAAVRLIEIPNCEPGKWREWLTMMAYADVAGGVVGRRLFPTSSGGDDGDKQIFMGRCAELVSHFGGISIDAEMVWTRARKAVERQLEEHPQIMELIQQRAIELRPLLGL
jgi:hypothetical protein